MTRIEKKDTRNVLEDHQQESKMAKTTAKTKPKSAKTAKPAAKKVVAKAVKPKVVKPKVVKAKVEKPKTARKPNAAFMKEKKISDALAAIVGKGPMPRTEITKKLWAYIKKNKLQDPKAPRNIVPDDKLKQVIGSKTIDMFKMTALVNKHVLD